MAILLLLVAFWLPFGLALWMGAAWWGALIAGGVACGSLFTYLIIKSNREFRSEEEVDMTAMEAADMAM